MRSKLYVAFQLLILVFLVLIGDLFPNELSMYIPWVIGLLIIVWAFLEKRMSVSIFPDPTTDMKLITTGPYKIVRHPIYTGVLLFTASWIPIVGKWELYLLVWFSLVVIFLLKIFHEELLLEDTFSNYQEYQEKTDRLIPFIY